MKAAEKRVVRAAMRLHRYFEIYGDDGITKNIWRPLTTFRNACATLSRRKRGK